MLNVQLPNTVGEKVTSELQVRCSTTNGAHQEKCILICMSGAGIAQPVQWLATGCKTEGSKFEPSRVKYLPFSTSSRPTTPPIKWVPGILSPGGIAAGARS
jgi:hypothetical protein